MRKLFVQVIEDQALPCSQPLVLTYGRTTSTFFSFLFRIPKTEIRNAVTKTGKHNSCFTLGYRIIISMVLFGQGAISEQESII